MAQGGGEGASETRAATPHIGAVASRASLSLRTVRYYEEVGLVRPSGRADGASGSAPRRTSPGSSW